MLVGQFEAICARDDKVSRSSKLFLPVEAAELIRGMVDSGSADAGISIQFGFEIFAVGAPNSSVGYEYECHPISAPGQEDPLTKMRKLMLGHSKADSPTKLVETPQQENTPEAQPKSNRIKK